LAVGLAINRAKRDDYCTFESICSRFCKDQRLVRKGMFRRRGVRAGIEEIRAAGWIVFEVSGRSRQLRIRLGGRGVHSERFELSAPSTLKVRPDGELTWSQPRVTSFEWSQPYTAANTAAEFP